MIRWCIKKGLELVESNSNLAEEYLIKAENSLRATKSLKNNKEWLISASYYAMYFSLYAILVKIGIKCEIHKCSIKFADRFLSELLNKKDIKMLKQAMKSRINLQYYTDRNISLKKEEKIVNFAPDFYIKCKEIIENLGDSDVDKIRSGFLSFFQ